MESNATVDDWDLVVRAAGLRLVKSALPRQLRCPFCIGGRAKVFNDGTEGRLRFYSTCCNLRLDLPEFLARVRSEPIKESLGWLKSVAPKLHASYVESPADTRLQTHRACKLLSKTWEIAIPTSKAVVSAAFSRMMNSHGVRFQSVLDWHPQNLDEQFRLITPEHIKKVFASYDRAFKHPVATALASVRSEYMVARLMTVPWQMAGLHFFATKGSDQPQHFCALAEISPADVAYMCHPRVLIDDTRLIITDDKVAAFRASFVNGQQSSLPSPFVAISDHATIQSTSLQSLLGRTVLIWCNRLSPNMICIASQINARITCHGFENGTISNDQLRQLTGYNAYEVLVSKSVPWQMAVVAVARHSAPEDTARFLQSSLISVETIEDFLDRWLPEQKEAVTNAKTQPNSRNS